MVLTSHLFPPALAILQTVRHLGLIAYTYWEAARSNSRFDVWEFIQKDFARPWFEPYGFCGAYTHYASGQVAVLGLDFPAYLAATLFHSIVTWSASCVDALMTPRGHVMSAVFVLPLWFLTGLSIRRLLQLQWRRRANHFIGRAFLTLGLLLIPFGVLSLVGSVFYLLAVDIWQAIRFVGLAFWFLYFAALATERLRVWPFDRIALQIGK